MAERLKNTLAFDLAPGASVAIPHGLCTSRPRPLGPDIIFVPSPDLSVTATTLTVTLTNNGGTPVVGSVLVEAWHTIERAFADTADEDLPVKPYIVVSAENGNEPPQPAFVSPPQLVTIYARSTGSDATGNGKTIPTAYRTVQRAARDVPTIVPGGVYYVIDATDLIDGGPEALPPNYSLPVWKSGRGIQFSEQFVYPPLSAEADVLGAVTLRAVPRNVPALGAEAVIAEGDLETTDVATIVSTSAGPITVTTTAPHKLVQSPFGIEGFFEGLVQPVTITGAVDPAANGTYLGLPTKPTNDESVTFELWDFDPNTETFFQIIGVGGGAGGTVSVFYVQDQRSGNTEVKVSTPRASWLPNGSLKGKMLIDGSGDHGVIYANTDDTLFLTHNRGRVSFDNGPIRIMEQTCILECSDSGLFGRIGGFNVINQDSFAMEGIEVKASADGSGFYQLSGLCYVDSCKLENPSFENVITQAFVGNSYLIHPFYYRCNIYMNRNLVDNVEVNGIPEWDAHQGTVFFQDELPLANPLGGAMNWFSAKVISTTDPVIDIICEDALLTAVSIEGGSGAAVRVGTQGRCTLMDVGGSGWTGTALVVDNGAQVEIDVWSFVKTDEMLVGNLAARTFDDFRTNIPLRQYYDLTTINPATGAEGTGSRVFQRDP
jgi:hypothetical protein